MNYDRWSQKSWRGMLWSIYSRLDKISQMLRKIDQKETQLMATDADILAAETAEGDKLTKLMALTDAIFAKVQAAPADNPVAQEVLDLIAAHNADMDATLGRDALPSDPPAQPPTT